MGNLSSDVYMVAGYVRKFAKKVYTLMADYMPEEIFELKRMNGWGQFFK
jgi:hypothetical protein